ncbi:MAG: PAN domain-containing protein [Candidatus Vecturithrix sp.]|jgi:hypothetical protein|nr:PAN domain-containing protein [Candidatus Vecturithrix sp.]
MKVFIGMCVLGRILVGLLVLAGAAEQISEPQKHISKCEGTVAQTIEIRIQHLDNHTEIPSWTGQIFALADGKLVAAVSSAQPCQQLGVGNYLLMLTFQEKLPDIEALRPFTFSISASHKTIFTLQLGKLETLEIEYGVGRSGADFIENDPRRGRDYVNFELPKDSPELCLDRCKKDPNCDAYSYNNSPNSPTARCWLIHGVAVPRFVPHAVSGVINRDISPYRVQIVTENLKSEE